MSSIAAGRGTVTDADVLSRFSLALDGPLYRLYVRWHLLAPPVRLTQRRIAAFVAVTWLPLLALTLIEGRALGGARVPFLADLGAQIRLLVALPLLVAAEPIVHWRIAKTVRPFLERGIVAPEDRAAFGSIVETSIRLRGSVVVEIALLAVTTILGVWLRGDLWGARTDIWYAVHDAHGGVALTAAGWWYAIVSLNLFRFVLVRWYFRLLIWYEFLWRTSRLRLQLNPLHPDRAGGLGFLAGSLIALSPVFLAQTVTVAGSIAGRIIQDGIPLEAFVFEIVALPLILAIIATLPLGFFAAALLRSSFDGAHEFGRLATRYVDDFRRRWIVGEDGAGTKEQLLGSPDIQSLADLGNAYETVRGVRALPVGFRSFIDLVLVLALPFLPLALTKVPLEELLRRLLEKVI